MQLGQQNITAGDIRRYQVDYCQFLQQGETLSSSTLTDTGPTSTVQGAFFDATGTQLYFFVTAGILGEIFVVNLQVKTTFGETVNDTISFTVVAP